MTIDQVRQRQEPNQTEKPPMTVQNDAQKDLNKEVQDKTTQGTGNNQTIGDGNAQKQVQQGVIASQPERHIQQVAQSQIDKGYVDVYA